MKAVLFLWLLCLSRQSLALSAKEIDRLYLVQGCTVLNMDGALISHFPGQICQFFSNGDFISASPTGLRYFSRDNELRWQIKGHFHHQVNLSHDQKRILALTSKISLTGDTTVRADRFIVVDLSGSVLHEQTADELFRLANIPPLKKPLAEWLRVPTGADEENSHFNSMYEIPPQLAGPRHPAIKAGNVILNGYSQGFFILSSDLKTLHHHLNVPSSHYNQTHDVQVTKRGTILYFNNTVVGSNQRHSHSSIEEIDPVTEKHVVVFEATPKAMFFARACGGVQELDDDHLLLADNLNGTFIYSRQRKEMDRTYRVTHFLYETQLSPQQVKGVDLAEFLQQRK